MSFPEKYSCDGEEGVYGRYYSYDELVKECIKDKKYYYGKLNRKDQWNIKYTTEINNLPGGITFSGGEPLMQMESLEKLCKKLHDQGIHLAIETSLFASPDLLEMALRNIDLFFVDIKILNSEQCLNMEHGDLRNYLENMDILFHWRDDEGNKKPVIIRVPVIGEKTESKENRIKAHELIKKYKNSILKIELLKEHNLAEKKYRSLGRFSAYQGVSDQTMQIYKDELSDLGIQTEICSFT